MTIWRSHIKIVGSVGRSRIDLCLNKNVLAMGWSLNDGHLKEHNFNEDEKTKICKQRSAINSYDNYEALIKEWKIYGGNVDNNVRRLYYNVKPDDLVWIRDKGIYYIGRVGENSQWIYDSSRELLDRDSTTQRTDIEWIKVGDESSVPGAVTIAFIRGKTLQRIASREVETFSKHYYNTIMKKEHYQGLAIEPNK